MSLRININLFTITVITKDDVKVANNKAFTNEDKTENTEADVGQSKQN